MRPAIRGTTASCNVWLKKSARSALSVPLKCFLFQNCCVFSRTAKYVARATRLSKQKGAKARVSNFLSDAQVPAPGSRDESSAHGVRSADCSIALLCIRTDAMTGMWVQSVVWLVDLAAKTTVMITVQCYVLEPHWSRPTAVTHLLLELCRNKAKWWDLRLQPSLPLYIDNGNVTSCTFPRLYSIKFLSSIANKNPHVNCGFCRHVFPLEIPCICTTTGRLFVWNKHSVLLFCRSQETVCSDCACYLFWLRWLCHQWRDASIFDGVLARMLAWEVLKKNCRSDCGKTFNKVCPLGIYGES